MNSVNAQLDPKVGAVFVEPIQGEAGVVVPPRDFLASVQRVARANGAVLVVDEVQSGMGRTGSWFAYQNPLVAEGEIPSVRASCSLTPPQGLALANTAQPSVRTQLLVPQR
jgi:acetylornithine aminotransferase